MKHGHCNVASGTPLGNWVSQQRTLSKDNTYRRERLNRLGFCWHPRGSSWDQSFGESKEFEVSSYVTVVGLKWLVLSWKLTLEISTTEEVRWSPECSISRWWGNLVYWSPRGKLYRARSPRKPNWAWLLYTHPRYYQEKCKCDVWFFADWSDAVSHKQIFSIFWTK